MDSIFNIFGTCNDNSVQLQQRNAVSTSSFSFKESVPVKQRARDDSFNVLGKKVLGDLGNKIQPSGNRDNTKTLSLKSGSHKLNKTPGQDVHKAAASSKLTRATLSTNKSPLLKSSNNVSGHTQIYEDLPEPEIQGEGVIIEDYRDIWPLDERPSKEELYRLVNVWENCRKPTVFECPPSPVFNITPVEDYLWLEPPMSMTGIMDVAEESIPVPKPIPVPWDMD